MIEKKKIPPPRNKHHHHLSAHSFGKVISVDAFFGRAAHKSFEHLVLHATVKYEVLEVNLSCTAGVEQFKHDTQVLHLGILQPGSICSLRAMRLVRVPLLHKERAESHSWSVRLLKWATRLPPVMDDRWSSVLIM